MTARSCLSGVRLTDSIKGNERGMGPSSRWDVRVLGFREQNWHSKREIF